MAENLRSMNNVMRAIVIVQLFLSAGMAQDSLRPAAAPGLDVKSTELARSRIREPSTEAFVDIEYRDLPKQVRGAVYSRLELVLQPTAKPYSPSQPLEPGTMKIRVYATTSPEQDDLIECSWQFLGQSIRALLGIDMLRIDINMTEVGARGSLDVFGNEPLARLKSLVSALIKFDGIDLNQRAYHVDFPWPSSLVDGTVICTNSDQDLTRMDYYQWYNRVDAFVAGHTFSLLFNMKPGQIIGFRDGAKMFLDDFRAQVHQKAREQGKLPPEPAKSEE